MIDLIILLSVGSLLFVSLLSVGMLAAQSRVKDNKTERKLLKLTVGYFLCMAVCCLTFIFFNYEFKFYVYSSPVFFLSLLLSVVFFYHIIYVLTSDNPSSNPSVIHYIIPFLLSIINRMWSLSIPYNVQFDIIGYYTLNLDSPEDLNIFNTAKLWFYLFYNFTYAILILRRMRIYRNYVNNYAADEDKFSLHWMYSVIFGFLAIIPVCYVIFLLKPERNIAYDLLLIFTNVLYAVMLVTLQYNMFMKKYVMIYEGNGENNNYPIVNIDRKKFENYMREKKPYLKSSLKITDIIYDLNTCRSYLSSFINRTYGMNFSYYINHLRMEEFIKIRNDASNKKLTDAELANRVGFSYRTFLRFRKCSDKNSDFICASGQKR